MPTLLMTTPAGIPVYGFQVPGAPRTWWRRLRAQHATTGLWPLLMSPATGAELQAQPWTHGGLRESTGRPAALGREPEEHELTDLAEGEWPEDPERREPTDEGAATIALLPVTAPWQIPLLLEYGGWNRCPEPPVHAEILHHFHTHYGAELVALNPTGAEFAVSRPPATRREALTLAWDYEMYCDASDLYGADTLPELAAALLAAPTWDAWWD
jgi:hypothetical protein